MAMNKPLAKLASSFLAANSIAGINPPPEPILAVVWNKQDDWSNISSNTTFQANTTQYDKGLVGELLEKVYGEGFTGFEMNVFPGEKELYITVYDNDRSFSENLDLFKQAKKESVLRNAPWTLLIGG